MRITLVSAVATVAMTLAGAAWAQPTSSTPPALRPEAVVRAEAVTRIRRAMAACDRSGRYSGADDYGVRLVQFPTRAAADAAAERDMASQIESEKFCFTQYRNQARAAGAADLAAEIDALMANAPARLRAAHQRGRIAFEANPVAYMWDDNGKLPGKLRSLLTLVSKPLSLPETCGVFNTAIPPLNNPALTAFNQRYEAHRQCLNAWAADRDNVQGRIGNGAMEFDNAITLLQVIRPYVCSAWARPNCVPDARWNALAAVATPRNAATVKAAGVRAGNRREVSRREGERMQQTMDAVNAAVRAVNAAR